MVAVLVGSMPRAQGAVQPHSADQTRMVLDADQP
jgi:hypothetical protein